jgi:hypothetical protein
MPGKSIDWYGIHEIRLVVRANNLHGVGQRWKQTIQSDTYRFSFISDHDEEMYKMKSLSKKYGLGAKTAIIPLLAFTVGLTSVGLTSGPADAQTKKTKFSSMAEWNLKAKNLVPWGHNPWFQPLQPGHSYTMDNPKFDDNGVKGHYVKTVVVLPKPKEFNIAKIGGKFKCAAVEEKEFLNKLQFSRSLIYYCFDKTTKTVYTMGKEGWKTKNARGDMSYKITESWIAGNPDSNSKIEAGLIMPGKWKNGMAWIIDGAAGRAFVGAEAAGSGLSITTPAGAFNNCVRTREHDMVDGGNTRDKLWCHGVGLVSDTSHGMLLKAAHLPKATKPRAPMTAKQPK